MKNLFILFLLSLCLTSFQIKAQAPFNTMDSVDINKIHAGVLVHGDMWWDPVNENTQCDLYGVEHYNINFVGAIWMSGYDAGNNLHISAQTNRQTGNDYWPGPLDPSGALTYSISQKWAKIWKVNGTDVQYFNSLSTHTIANTPPAILTWPGKGNTYAQGNGGAALTITYDMAPFVDLNGNGVYEPLLGEYPDFIGDQALWWVFSDNGPTHSETHGTPLGVEIHAMAYAYSRGTLIDNVIYYDYTIINKSANNYHNFLFALWDDVILGFYLNDFIGFDSIRRLGICYYGTNDDGAGGGHPVNSYGSNSPVVGVTMISLPGDVGTTYVPTGSFDYYNNDQSGIGKPMVDTEYNNYMRARLRNGQHFTDDFTGPHNQSKGYGSGPDCNYVFTGDPSDSTQWSECACNNVPGDRRFIFASNDFTLNAGSTQHVVMALVATDTGDGGCPQASFAKIRIVTDTAWNVYYNPLTPLYRSAPTGTTNISTYPNPTHDLLYIEDKLHNLDAASVTIYNFIGEVINIPIHKNGQRLELDISHLPTGLYNALYHNGTVQTSTKFLKE